VDSREGELGWAAGLLPAFSAQSIRWPALFALANCSTLTFEGCELPSLFEDWVVTEPC